MRYNFFIVVKCFEIVDWKALCKLLLKIINLEELALDWIQYTNPRLEKNPKVKCLVPIALLHLSA